MALSSVQQELADGYIDIIGQINTGRDAEQIRRLVQLKVGQLTAQEPLYLWSIL